MKAVRLSIKDVVLLSPEKKTDTRGFFSETFSQRIFEKFGVAGVFVQDNHSMSEKAYVIRGLHFQIPPHAQDKLVRVATGKILDVAVDIRQGSSTYGNHVAAILSAENWNQLWIPRGFAHGYCTLEANTEVLYKVTDYYSPDYEVGLAYDDPGLNIDWQLPEGVIPLLSDKDKNLPVLKNLPEYFSVEGAAGCDGGNAEK